MVELKCPNCGAGESEIEVIEAYDNGEIYVHDCEEYLETLCMCDKCHKTFQAMLEFELKLVGVEYITDED